MSQQIVIESSTQRLHLFEDEKLQSSFPISTAKNGLGEIQGSECTPRGWHIIRAKIGDNLPIYSVLVGRRFTGEIFSPRLKAQYPQRDWILSRILWLKGLERGKNKRGPCDSMRRFIYIHGTDPTSQLMPFSSKGCIRMENQAIIELFERVAVNTPVLIRP